MHSEIAEIEIHARMKNKREHTSAFPLYLAMQALKSSSVTTSEPHLFRTALENSNYMSSSFNGTSYFVDGFPRK
jgi:hypothetical protein